MALAVLVLLLIAPLIAAEWPPQSLIDEALGSQDSLDALLGSRSFNSIATRDLARCAWIALAVPRASGGGPNVSAAQRYLGLLFAAQLPSGQFPWLLSEDNLTDPNAINFVALPLSAAWLVYGGALGSEFSAQYAGNMSAVGAALLAHDVPVFYTNIFTMRLVSELVLGAALAPSQGGDALWTQGLEDWRAWAAAVAAAGLHEYNSPTYSQVTLDNFLTGSVALASKNSTVSELFASAAAFVSTALLADYVPAAGGSLGGAHSRDYDFLFGQGSVGHFFTLANASDAPPPPLGNQSEGIYDTIAVHLGYAGPPAASFNNASVGAPVRIVQQTFCPSPPPSPCVPAGSDRYSYVLPGVALGTSSSYYGPQDKQVVGLLAASPSAAISSKLVQVTLVYDKYDAPWGLRKAPDSSGHEKPDHLANSAAAVQDGGLALVLGDLSPQWAADVHTRYDSVAANVLFPSDAGALYVDGQRIWNTTSFNTHLGATLCVLSNASTGGAIAARIFAADAIDGYGPVVDVRFDGPRGTGAARLVAYLYRGANRTLAPPTSRVGVLFAAAETHGDPARVSALLAAVAGAEIKQSFAAGLWTVDAELRAPAPAGLGAALSAVLNVTGRAVAARTVNGSAYAPALFRVWNGSVALDVVPPFA